MKYKIAKFLLLSIAGFFLFFGSLYIIDTGKFEIEPFMIGVVFIMMYLIMKIALRANIGEGNIKDVVLGEQLWVDKRTYIEKKTPEKPVERLIVYKNGIRMDKMFFEWHNIKILQINRHGPSSAKWKFSKLINILGDDIQSLQIIDNQKKVFYCYLVDEEGLSQTLNRIKQDNLIRKN